MIFCEYVKFGAIFDFVVVVVVVVVVISHSEQICKCGIKYG